MLLKQLIYSIHIKLLFIDGKIRIVIIVAINIKVKNLISFTNILKNEQGLERTWFQEISKKFQVAKILQNHQTTRPCFPMNARGKKSRYLSSYYTTETEGRRRFAYLWNRTMLDSTRTVVERRLAATPSELRAICSAYTSTDEPLSGLLATLVSSSSSSSLCGSPKGGRRESAATGRAERRRASNVATRFLTPLGGHVRAPSSPGTHVHTCERQRDDGDDAVAVAFVRVRATSATDSELVAKGVPAGRGCCWRACMANEDVETAGTHQGA